MTELSTFQNDQLLTTLENMHYAQEGVEPGLLYLTAQSVFFDTPEYLRCTIEGSKDKRYKRRDPTYSRDLNKGVHLGHITNIWRQNDVFRWFFTSSMNCTAKFRLKVRNIREGGCTIIVEINQEEQEIQLEPGKEEYTWEADLNIFKTVIKKKKVMYRRNELAIWLKEGFQKHTSAFDVEYVEIDVIDDNPTLHVVRADHNPDANHVQFFCSQIDRPKAWIMGMTPLDMKQGCFCPMGTPGQYQGFGFETPTRPGDFMVFAVHNHKDVEPVPNPQKFSKILGVGCPDTIINNYGHEGNGSNLKSRARDIWASNTSGTFFTAHRQDPKLFEIQGGSKYFYAGFYFDEGLDKWMLFAVYDKFRSTWKDRDLRVKMFIEVGGGANGDRSGHLVRRIGYQAWAYDDDTWEFVDVMEAKTNKKKLVNKSRGVENNMFFASTGGIVYRRNTRRNNFVLDEPKELPRARQLAYQLHEPIVLPSMQLSKQDNVVIATVTIPETPQCMRWKEIPANENKHHVEIHIAQDDRIHILRRVVKLKRPPRTQLKTNWDHVATFEDLLPGIHTLELYDLEPNKTWYMQVYIRNSVMQLHSRDSVSIKL